MEAFFKAKYVGLCPRAYFTLSTIAAKASG